MSTRNDGERPPASNETQWLRRARKRNRIMWAAIGVMFVSFALDKAEVPVVGLLFFPSVAVMVAHAVYNSFFTSCPRCKENFYDAPESNLDSFENPFARRCFHCGLSWKGLPEE